MTLKQLEYFLAIADTGSVTRAAQNLNISQPPLSLQLKALEDELGVRLFDRQKKSLVITKAGTLLRERAKAIMALVNDSVQDIQNLSSEQRTTIHIGTISSVCSRLLPEKILAFSKGHPHVEFQIFEGSTTTIQNHLAEQVVELGIIREPFNASIYHTIPIRDTALGFDTTDYLTAIGQEKFFDEPGAATLPLDSLRGKPIIIHRRYRDMLVNACRKKGFIPNIVCQNDELSSSLSWASSSIGIAIVPYSSALQNTDPALIAKRIDYPTLISRAFLVWNRGTKLNDETRAFISLF